MRWVAVLFVLLAGAGCGAAPPRAGTPGTPLVVSPHGSDSSSCRQASPCKSFERAYEAAVPGEVVHVAAGTYGDQDLRYDPAKAHGPDVVFRPVAGARVSIGDLVFGPDMGTRGASHVTVQGMTLRGNIQVLSCGAGPGRQCLGDGESGGTYITLRNLTVLGPVGFFCASCGHVTIRGGTIGPARYGHPCNGSNHPEVQNLYDSSLPGDRKLKRSHDLVVDGSTWQNFSACTDADHTECLQIEPADDVIIRHSIFRRCDTITVNLANDLAGNSRSPAGYRAPDHVVIEDNFFDRARSLPGAPTYYALNIRECTNCLVRHNTWLQAPRLPTGEVSRNVRFVGNVGPFLPWDCRRAHVGYANNTWVGAKCGPTDKEVASLAALHLKNPGRPSSVVDEDQG